MRFSLAIVFMLLIASIQSAAWAEKSCWMAVQTWQPQNIDFLSNIVNDALSHENATLVDNDFTIPPHDQSFQTIEVDSWKDCFLQALAFSIQNKIEFPNYVLWKIKTFPYFINQLGKVDAFTQASEPLRGDQRMIIQQNMNVCVVYFTDENDDLIGIRFKDDVMGLPTHVDLDFHASLIPASNATNSCYNVVKNFPNSEIPPATSHIHFFIDGIDYTKKQGVLNINRNL